jgi:ketosteroid isomerase-like protein
MPEDRQDRTARLDEAVTAFGEAWAKGDIAALNAMLAPGYTHTDAFGAYLDRASWLGYAGGRAGRTTGIRFRQVETRIHGDVAIVTGINELDGPGIANAQDRSPLTIRFTQVWLWRDGRWLREAFQATPCRSGPSFE